MRPRLDVAQDPHQGVALLKQEGRAGARRALRDSNNAYLSKKENSGLLLSWDRTISEITDKLWFGVDYMGGENRDGSVNLGFAWRFNKYVALTIGYDQVIVAV